MTTITTIKIIRTYKCNGVDGLVIELDGQRVASLISKADAKRLMLTRTQAERDAVLADWLGVKLAQVETSADLDERAEAVRAELARQLPNAAAHISVRASEYRGAAQRKVTAYDANRRELGTIIVNINTPNRVFAKRYVAAFAHAANA